MPGWLTRVLSAMLKIGTIGFGGGSALIPVFEKELVRRRRVLDDATFTTHTVIANITPGALPVKLGALAGTHVHGAVAGLVAAIAVAVPGALATVALLATFRFLGPDAIRWVERAAVGITCFIIVLLLHYIANVVRGPRRVLHVTITLLAFLLTGTEQAGRLLGQMVGVDWLPEVPTLGALGLVVAALVALGLYSLWPGRGSVAPAVGVRVSRSHHFASLGFLTVLAVLVPLTFAVGGVEGAAFVGLIALSSITSFGGGEAYVGVADGFFVQAGFVSPDIFYGQLVPVANAMPGPILVKIASGLGYGFGAETGGPVTGTAFAVICFFVSIAACSAVALAVMAAYGRVSQSRFVQDLGDLILPVICGLLLTTSVSMVSANVDIGLKEGLAAPWLAWGSID